MEVKCLYKMQQHKITDWANHMLAMNARMLYTLSSDHYLQSRATCPGYETCSIQNKNDS